MTVRGAPRPFSFLAILLIIPATAPVSAQTAAVRTTLSAFSDSLAASADSSALRARQRALRESLRRSPADAITGLRMGLVSLRMAELNVTPDARDAVRAFRKAAEQQPSWPLAWYSLGRAEARRAEWEQRDSLALGSRVGLGTLERAADRHRRALEADPGYAPAAVALAELALGLRDTARLASTVTVLRRAAAADSPPPDVLLEWGRIERAAEGDSAVVAFERYLGAGGNRGVGLLELARTALAAGDSSVSAAYFEGAELEDRASIAGYRADLVPVAQPAELAEFDRARGPARAAFLHRFWSDRDRLDMRAPGERLREHYRRLLYARRHFALTVSRRFYGPADAYRAGGMEIDDRGVIYVRHGVPTTRLRPFVFGLMPNESWRFGRSEGDLLFHFSSGWDANGGGDLYDYRLVESILDLRGAAEAPEDQLMLSRQAFSPVYGRMLNWGRYGAARARSRERGIGQASIAIGTTTDSHELRFAQPLGALADLVVVGDRGGTPLGHLVFAVAEPGTEPEPAGEGVRYTVRVRAVASDGKDRPFADVDTTLVFRPSMALGRSQYLIGRVELPLPPGSWRWRAAVQLGDSSGVVLPRDTVRVAGTDGSSLSLSDLALGVREASARWVPAPGDTVLLTPFDLFREGSEVELYYETAGASAGTAYRHEIAVYRLRGEPALADRRPVVALAFDERAHQERLRSHRVLQLARLKPGRYLVEVQVRAPDGSSVARRREFRVVRRET